MHLGATNIHSKPTQKVGFVLKTHGFNGHLKIDLDEDYSPSKFLLLSINDKFVPFEIEHFNENGLIVKLKGFNSSDVVAHLVNLEIVDFTNDSIEEDLNIVGYDLIDTQSGIAYPITDVVYLPNNILIEFRVKYKDVLLPYHEDIVIEIDDNAKTVKAIFPDGILDL